MQSVCLRLSAPSSVVLCPSRCAAGGAGLVDELKRKLTAAQASFALAQPRTWLHTCSVRVAGC
eukprot:4070572-Pleurochrysis_carterae.AAC.4